MVLIQGNWVLEISFVQRQQQQRQQQSLGTARSLTEPSLTKRFFLLSFVTSSTLPNQCYFANKHTNAIAWLPSSKSLSIWEQTQFLAFLTVVSPNCPFFAQIPLFRSLLHTLDIFISLSRESLKDYSKLENLTWSSLSLQRMFLGSKLVSQQCREFQKGVLWELLTHGARKKKWLLLTGSTTLLARTLISVCCCLNSISFCPRKFSFAIIEVIFHVSEEFEICLLGVHVSVVFPSF